ncbi:unnamed protein product [Dimorphilus gyrociliatus]|uniref:sphingomyelin phosphodiesterase n=1 Tax=Dimorphilus gyrociliatus TaxID=2664684 RepID=A0A7I8W0J6_9ANNE|nr:unnamed protein product [Dimorphilus gyrociliatus]
MLLKALFLFSLLAIAHGCCKKRCKSDSLENPFNGKCYQIPPEPERPAVWLDDCDRVPSDCDNYGLIYDLQHPKGDGPWCSSGQKIRCLLPEKPKLTVTGAKEFKIISINVMERNYYMTLDGQNERTCRIVPWLLSNFPNLDAIAFQETFMGGCFSNKLNLRDILTYYGFKYQTETIYSTLKILNGGTFIASKWPIVDEYGKIFTTANPWTFEYFVAKGVSYGKIVKTVESEQMTYNVMTTHMQSSGSNYYREAQCREWADFSKSLDIPSNEALIFSGDLNMDVTDPSLKSCIDLLNGTLPEISGFQKASYDPNSNDILQIEDMYKQTMLIDFVFPSKMHRQPEKASQEIIQMKSNDYFKICYCSICVSRTRHVFPDDDCERVAWIQQLSDHYAVLGHFKF